MTANYKIYTGALLLTLLTACGSSDDDSETIVCGNEEPVSIDEGGILDFSNDPADPLAWTLAPGVNNLVAGTSSEDQDYVAFTVDTCDVLSSITVGAFNSDSGNAIVSMYLQAGPVFTVSPENAADEIGDINGLVSFGADSVGFDILTLAGQQPDVIGFTSPLGPGQYTLWLSQLDDLAEYTLLFNVDRVLSPE